MNPRRAVLLASAALWITPPASAYEVVEVPNGGTVKGAVSVKDRGLKDETLSIIKDADYCGESLPAEKYLVSPEGRLQNAVVMIEAIARGKPIESEVDLSITNQKCRFVPHVMVAHRGETIKIRNDDPILHTVHYYQLKGDGKRHVTNLAQPRQGFVTGKERILRNPGLLRVICNAHVFMQAWAWVVEHPYATVTPEDGSFVLGQVPPGTYKLRIWHEALGEEIVDITVEAGKVAWVNVAL